SRPSQARPGRPSPIPPPTLSPAARLWLVARSSSRSPQRLASASPCRPLRAGTSTSRRRTRAPTPSPTPCSEAALPAPARILEDRLSRGDGCSSFGLALLARMGGLAGGSAAPFVALAGFLCPVLVAQFGGVLRHPAVLEILGQVELRRLVCVHCIP